MRMRLYCLTLALLWTAGVSAASPSDEARAWITRMNDAVINRNYIGVLTHRWKDGSETVRLIHGMRDGKLVERVISLDGTGLEIVRDGTQYIRYLPARPGEKKRIVTVESRNRSYGYIAALNGVNAGSEQNYSISLVGTQRLLGWPNPTQVVLVLPKDDLRYGYRLWLDTQSFLPVKTQLINKAREAIDDISFSELKVVDSIPDAMLRPAVDPDDLHWKKRQDANSQTVKVAFVPRTDQLPPGYRKLDMNAAGGAAAAGRDSRFIVSDGISWVSVVITVSGKSPEGFTEGFGPSVGAAATYVVRRDGHDISVMGEVPPAVAKAIARAVVPE